MPSKSTFACVRCAERKVKCDRQRPCSACVNHKVECIFQPPRTPQRSRRRIKDQILTDRLRYYETLLRDQGINPKKLSDTRGSDAQRRPNETVAVAPKESHASTPSAVESEASESVSKTQVIQGQGRAMFVDNSLWSRVVEEFRDPDDPLDDSVTDSSDADASDDEFSFVLGGRPRSNPKSRHPPPHDILQLWQIFIENIDPLTKIVHVPTVQPAIEKAASNIRAIPRSFEALMFAIYGTAVMSLNDDECLQKLGETRKTLLLRYTTATKAALSRARFMGTTNLVVLQALVLHLLYVRDIDEPRAVWSLTGVAVRLAQGMGLDRDGVALGLSPFETEMRRRIWWMLKTHDFRIAELCGRPKFLDLDMGPYGTKCPTNINDDQLYPSMPSLLPDSNGLTDMTFVALRYELASFATKRVAKFRQEGNSLSEWERELTSKGDKVLSDETFREIEGLLEMKYLRYCDPSQPLHLITMLMARSSMNTIRFLTHHPRRWASLEQTPSSERQFVWEISIKLLEQNNMLQADPHLKQFAWHAAFSRQWHAFIHVLDTLRAQPLMADAEKAWELIGNTYKNNPALVFNTRKPIHVAVGSLCLKAYSARASALRPHGNIGPPPTPEFILQLRRQREVTKGKKHARDAKNRQGENSDVHGPAKPGDMGPRPDAGVVYSSDTLGTTHLQPGLTSHPLVLAPHDSSGATGEDSFWVLNGFDDSQLGCFNGGIDMDLDLMLAQDPKTGDHAQQSITWEQWDTWLAESSAMLPLSSGQDLRAGT
ncbi:hypothetical protein BP6252_08945 [Coleophoma cylindrospora]|uniref:Zn(2)-C6 fungal-type domain-containing protein n=1 Tax=Coleophoma cylindrospora TaxID=1849047 RepID=A0A3D8R0I3_9HELO|nr:hypothetical protein BP6252_08945 [Coleophoma cylindrospora]